MYYYEDQILQQMFSVKTYRECSKFTSKISISNEITAWYNKSVTLLLPLVT